DRVRARRDRGPDDYRLPDDVALAHVDTFEEPTFDEYPMRIVAGDLEYRHVRPGETNRLLEFWADSAENAARPQDPAHAVDALLARDPASVVVAELAGQIVGTVIAGWDGWRAHLYRLAVHPRARGRGIARTLLRHAEERFVALGATRLDAMVLDANASGAAVWRAAGYRPQGGGGRGGKPGSDR
ncbi:GNAT family N-acetyltransferase, partial [Arsenicicoccus sp. UBA2120]|uniref:GNAT family N-acetyltransferase n=1 Tax=Arsenicicoccus sp. UBA2120 TaxID=1946055 RepID=UPI00257DEEAE